MTKILALGDKIIAGHIFALTVLHRHFPEAAIELTRKDAIVPLGTASVGVGNCHKPGDAKFVHGIHHHHRPDGGSEYGTFGLVWKELGSNIVRRALKSAPTFRQHEDQVAAATALLDKEFVSVFDEAELTGKSRPGTIQHLFELRNVDDFDLDTLEAGGLPREGAKAVTNEANIRDLLRQAGSHLDAVVYRAIKRVETKLRILEAATKSAVLILPRAMQWEEIVEEHLPHVLFVVAQHNDRGVPSWGVHSVAKSKAEQHVGDPGYGGSRYSTGADVVWRRNLPDSWAVAPRDSDGNGIGNYIGIEGARYLCPSLSILVTDDLSSAVKTANLAVETLEAVGH